MPYITKINLSGNLPTIATGFAVVAQQFGLDFDIWVMKVILKQDAGGTQDVVLQTQDQDNGPWSDIAHFPQLAAGASLFAYRVGFYRGLQASVTAQVVNPVDGTPVLPVNTIVTWANGLSLRCASTPGAGATGTGSATITGMAHES